MLNGKAAEIKSTTCLPLQLFYEVDKSSRIKKQFSASSSIQKGIKQMEPATLKLQGLHEKIYSCFPLLYKSQINAQKKKRKRVNTGICYLKHFLYNMILKLVVLQKGISYFSLSSFLSIISYFITTYTISRKKFHMLNNST